MNDRLQTVWKGPAPAGTMVCGLWSLLSAFRGLSPTAMFLPPLRGSKWMPCNN